MTEVISSGERRRLPRLSHIPRSLWAIVVAQEVSTLFSEQILSLSRSGVGMIVPHRIENTASVLIRLMNSAQSVCCERQARVVHARPCSENIWVIGCEFSEPLGSDELAVLLSQPSRAAVGSLS